MPWQEAKDKLTYVRQHGVDQFIQHYRRHATKQRDTLLYGDEIEYGLFELIISTLGSGADSRPQDAKAQEHVWCPRSRGAAIAGGGAAAEAVPVRGIFLLRAIRSSSADGPVSGAMAR